MARVFYVHWDEGELTARVEPLAAAGYDVAAHGTPGGRVTLGEPQPDAVVISLDRLPSHGREVAGWVWQSKARRAIPVVFEGGAPDKVAATRARFPGATFCATGEAVAALGGLGVGPG